MDPRKNSAALALSDLVLPGIFAIAKILLLLSVLGRLGLFRDEYYYLACARHLDWGYVDHPPLSIAFLAAWTATFGDALWALRAPAILAGAATVMLAGIIAREMGGGRYAQAMACITVFFAPLFLAVSNFYSMNVFDQFFWSALAWILVRFLNSGNPKCWLYFGAVAGLALQNKISVLVLGLGLVAGLLLTRHRAQFLKKELWLGGAIAALLFLPHVVWQVAHGFPTLEFLHNAATYKNTDSSPLQLFLGALLEMHPANALIWVPGLAFTLYGAGGKKFRLLGVTFLTVFLVFGFTNGKVYYLAPIMPLMLALGGVAWEHWTRKKRAWRFAIAAPVVLLGPALIPLALPVLEPAAFAGYQSRLGIAPAPMERHAQATLPQHFADCYGWQELAAYVDLMCATYLKDERAAAVILTSNYGEAGALEYYQEAFSLPPVICTHNNYFLWGPGNATGELVLAYGIDRASLETHFESVVETPERFEHPMVMPYQNNRPLYICRGLKTPLAELWPRIKHYI